MPSRDPLLDRLESCGHAGQCYRERAVASVARAYDRKRILPRLVAVTSKELADESIEGRRTLIARLLRVAQISASAGRSCHWSYDSNRHTAILGALQAEREALSVRLSRDDPKAAPLADARSDVST